MTVITKIEDLNKGKFYISFILSISLFFVAATAVFGNEPTGLMVDSSTATANGSDVFYAEPYEDAIGNLNDSKVIIGEEKKDSTEVEPKLEPLVLGGSAAVLVGVGAAVAAPFVAPILFLGAAVLFALGAFLTAKGWKKIKAEPKKFKGEKIAITNYIIIGLVGVAASFYLLYWIFAI